MRTIRIAVVALQAVLVAGSAGAQVDPSNSSCTVTITQNPARPQCIDNFEPDVLRLTPQANATPPFDSATIEVVARDASGFPVPGVTVKCVEMSDTVNISTAGQTSAVTDANGAGSFTISAGTGHALVGVCAGGVVLRSIEVRSPDTGTICDFSPPCCRVPTTSSSVSGSDITNPMCGFLAHFGAVTPGINNGFDLDCSNTVNGIDIVGTSGVLRYFGDFGTLGPRNTCP